MSKSVLVFLKMLFAIYCLGNIAFAATLAPPSNLRLATAKGNFDTTITHGSQLTTSMVGPGGLGVSISQLRKTSANGQRISTWPTDGLPSWIPNAPYIYNNDPSNHGGIVPAGGMTIDGFAVPGGTWVAQFDDFGNEPIIIAGNNNGSTPDLPGIVFRGCRWRGAITAPGYLNLYSGSNIAVFVLYSDAGGLGAADSQYNEIPFKLTDSTSSSVFFRNYISYTSTAFQPQTKGPQIVENYIEKITLFYGESGPPSESGPKHLNGISLNGGQANALILRNKVLLQTPDDAGHTIAQTDAIYFKQEPGTFPGTGINSDGSRGYLVKDNYLGGGGFVIYAGWDASYGAPTSGSLQNMVITGNKITNQWWPNGGFYGFIAKEPQWGTYGNVKSNNTIAETGNIW